MKLKKKIRSINFKTLVYLIIFSISILSVLMVSQTIFLNVSYERYQIKKAKRISNNILNSDTSLLLKKLESVAYDNGVCIEYYLQNEKISYNTLMIGCGLNKNNTQINNLISNIVNSNKDISNIKLTNKSNDTKAILSGIKVQDGYIFVYTALEDIDGASIILKNQLIYITFIVILIAIFISYFLSKKITNPITEITKKAKELGEGKYDIEFKGSDVLEIDELARTLNHAKEDLSKIDELRRDLMANVSHDLKTPLTMIRAYAECVRDISYKDKNKMDKDLNVIIDETERLNILVNDILELSKMQSSYDDLVISEFDLCAEIREVMKRYDILKINEDYNFILDLPSYAIIKADKNKINQVIYNLINNAINYTGDDKKVIIKLEKTKKDVTVSISDTGKGIKKEEIPYIWDKYYKKDKKHQRSVVSTGLGLSIVKEILAKHKFDYGVKSTEGKGSTFYFRVKSVVKDKNSLNNHK